MDGAAGGGGAEVLDGDALGEVTLGGCVPLDTVAGLTGEDLVAGEDLGAASDLGFAEVESFARVAPPSGVGTGILQVFPIQ